MKKLLRLLVIICLLATSISLVGCAKPYKGKDISSISFVSVDFMGGASKTTTFDFDNAVASVVKEYPYAEEYNSTKTYPLDRNKYQKLFDDLNKCGFFKLKELYEQDGIDDGGATTITVNYADGTSSKSECINTENGLEKKYGIAFYDFCGEYLVGYVPDSYRIPPKVDVIVSYDLDHRTTCNVKFPAKYTNYTLNKKTVNNIELLDGIKDAEQFICEDKISYTFSVTTKEKIKFITVDRYDLGGSSKTGVLSSNTLEGHSTQLVKNKIYKITVTYKKYGKAEYVFSTAEAK